MLLGRSLTIWKDDLEEGLLGAIDCKPQTPFVYGIDSETTNTKASRPATNIRAPTTPPISAIKETIADV